MSKQDGERSGMPEIPDKLEAVLMQTAENLGELEGRRRDNPAVRLRAACRALEAVLGNVLRGTLHAFAVELHEEGCDIEPSQLQGPRAIANMARFVLGQLDQMATEDPALR